MGVFGKESGENSNEILTVIRHCSLSCIVAADLAESRSNEKEVKSLAREAEAAESIAFTLPRSNSSGRSSTGSRKP
jgi:hypothetical protein